MQCTLSHAKTHRTVHGCYTVGLYLVLPSRCS